MRAGLPDSRALDKNSLENAGQADIAEVVLIKDKLCDLLTGLEGLLDALTDRFNQALAKLVAVDLQLFVFDAGLLREDDYLSVVVRLEEVADLVLVIVCIRRRLGLDCNRLQRRDPSPWAMTHGVSLLQCLVPLQELLPLLLNVWQVVGLRSLDHLLHRDVASQLFGNLSAA